MTQFECSLNVEQHVPTQGKRWLNVSLTWFECKVQVSRGMSVKKRIRKQKAEKVLARLNEIPNLTLSIREFVSMNFDTLQQSGKSLKVLYYFLSNNGIDVGTCESFKAIYNSVKHAQKLNA